MATPAMRGIFVNTDTGSDANYSVYASNVSASGFAVYCSATNTSGCGGNQGWYNSSDARRKRASNRCRMRAASMR